jgi:stage II sporulation protein P
MPREDAIVKPTAVINGRKAAQIMIIAGCDDGTMDMPDWPENLRFAVALHSKIEDMYPGLMRPIYLCYRKYNMQLSHGSLLLEFGSNANTLEEAVYSAQLAGKALAELIEEETA